MIKRILFLILSVIIFCIAFFVSKPPETELMAPFINPNSSIVKLANLSAKTVNVISSENLQLQKPDDYSAILDVYRNYPANFLSEHKRELLKDKKYSVLEYEALQGIYNPLGIYIAPLDKDPYLLSSDFVLSKQQEQEKEFEGKTYFLSRVKVKDKQDVEKLLEETDGKDVLLTGTPVHSYFAAKKSALEINIICFVSVLALIMLAKIFFRSVKLLVPIGLSILFGFLFGYSISALIFEKLHVLTFVFSTSLIGISLDYSLHYFCEDEDVGFRKSLTSSMLTTVAAFLTLMFSGIEVLRQIAVFTSFGLIGVYLFVIFILPMFPQIQPAMINGRIKFPRRAFYILLFAVIILGSFKISFEDNLKNLYVPPKHLLEAETMYQKVFNPTPPQFILVKGENIDEILEKQEAIEGFSLSNFVSSIKRQKENIALVEDLYANNLQQLENKTGAKFNPPENKIYSVENFPLNSEFMLDEKTSFVMVQNSALPPLRGKCCLAAKGGAYDAGKNCDYEIINVADEISKILKNLRHTALKLLPCVFAVLYILLSCLYGLKKALKISISPALGILFTVAALSLAGISLNLFHILGLFLIAGFSLDYSIFRIDGSEKSKNAVFMSYVSTAFSFLLLSLTSFKLISFLGITIFIGITVSYISSLFMIKSEHDDKR